MFQYNLGYLQYIVGLFVVTGLILLLFERKQYTKGDMTREANFARILGWINITLGVVTSSTNWVIGMLAG